MQDKTLVAIYSIKIRSQKKDDYITLKNGIENLDFLEVFQDYFNEILTTPQVLDTEKDTNGVEIPIKKVTLVSADGHKKNDTERYIIGEFYLGTSDKTIDIINFESNEKLLSDEEKKEYGYYRKFFFYLHIPVNKKIGYIVVQKVGKHGMKGDFEKGFRTWFNKQRYDDGRLTFSLNQIANKKLIQRLVKEKFLRQFKIIKYKVPVAPDSTYRATPINENGRFMDGAFEIVFKAKELTDNFKDFISKFMSGTVTSDRIELGGGIQQEFDDIQFSLEINGKPKSFYINKETRMRSDRDVTLDLDYVDRKPTIESLIRISKEMIVDFRIPD